MPTRYDTLIKEDISIAYAMAITAKAGFTFELARNDQDGVDAHIRGSVIVDEEEYNATIGVQLKSSNSCNLVGERDNCYTFSLKKKNYEDLITTRITVPRFLLLLLLHENEDEWIQQDIEKLVIKRCMYWVSLRGYADSENTHSVTVEIPKANILTDESLCQLLCDEAKGVY